MSLAEKANDPFAEKEIQLWVDNCELLMTAWQKYSKIVEAKLEARLKIIDEKEAEIKKLEGQIREVKTFLKTLVELTPVPKKISTYDSDAKEDWIIETADPEEYRRFYDWLDENLVRLGETLK